MIFLPARPLPILVRFDHRGRTYTARFIRGADRASATLMEDHCSEVVLQLGASDEQLLSALKCTI